MQGTLLEGPFPPTLSTLTFLRQLRISDLKVGFAKFPPLQNMIKMERLVLRNLSMSGELPGYLSQMPRLKTLDLSYNNMNGPIPSIYDGSVSNSINYLYLTNNNLTGTIPDWIQGSDKNLDLSYNSFTGLPAPLDCHQGSINLVSSYSSTSSKLIQPCLRPNFPCSGKAENYELFINCGGSGVIVDGNVFEEDASQHGPAQFAQSPDGKWAYSSTGDFMDNSNEKYIANNYTRLNMTNPELYTTARLSPLSLKYYGLCLQKGEYTVKLHFAEIMFTDNQSYASVGRRIFDVSIQGRKVLQDFNIAKEANGTEREIVMPFNASVLDSTLEIHFQWAGKGTHSIPHMSVYGPLVSAISVTPNFKPYIGKHKLSVGASASIAASAFFVVVLISTLIWVYLRRTDPDDPELRGLQTGYFSLRQIKSATNNFDPANKIGEGGFGPVFKGVLPDGSAIAVKQLSSKSKQGNREFVNEIGLISGLQHSNLVKLHGCCVEGNQLFLIYEYMENNSLAHVLFGPQQHRQSLDWRTRCEICLGIARGLAFLHGSRLKIIHRDIKATNILLDKNFNAKISDFGLAKLTEDENTHISTRIAGTRGYMAPEYATRGYLTHKADVYSFGVVILELVSGMSNTNYKLHEEFVYLLDWAYVLQERENLIELVDKSLGSNYSKEEALYMLSLALLCTNPSPTLRPSMPSVVTMLESKTPIKVPSTRNIKSTVYLGYNISGKSSQDSYPQRMSREDILSSSNAQSGVWVDDDPCIDESNYFTSKEASSLISSRSKSLRST